MRGDPFVVSRHDDLAITGLRRCRARDGHDPVQQRSSGDGQQRLAGQAGRPETGRNDDDVRPEAGPESG
jgi:hypothetical protein